MLSEKCYQYPWIYKFCELLEEYDDLGTERLSNDDWNKIFNIIIGGKSLSLKMEFVDCKKCPLLLLDK